MKEEEGGKINGNTNYFRNGRNTMCGISFMVSYATGQEMA